MSRRLKTAETVIGLVLLSWIMVGCAVWIMT